MPSERAKNRPNILVVMTDQQRFDSVGCYGADWVDTITAAASINPTFLYISVLLSFKPAVQTICAAHNLTTVMGSEEDMIPYIKNVEDESHTPWREGLSAGARPVLEPAAGGERVREVRA